MTNELAEPKRWSASRWWTMVALVLAAQFGLILWLGKPQPFSPRVNDFAPSLQLAGPGANKILAFNDPTLFARPHREVFSGEAWLNIQAKEFRPVLWSEPARWLTLVQQQLAVDFEMFMSTNRMEILPPLTEPKLELKVPVVSEPNRLPTKSTLRVTGALAQRRLLVSPVLPSWPSAEILTNSVVEVLVDARGKSVSMTLLKSSGFGPNEADQYALREARKVRFAPDNENNPKNPLAGLTWGQLVFRWHTLPLSATNSVAEAAQ
jgi:hypothetical protein